LLSADRCCRLPVKLHGALRQKLEEQDVQQDVQRLLQPLQLRPARHRPGETRHLCPCYDTMVNPKTGKPKCP